MNTIKVEGGVDETRRDEVGIIYLPSTEVDI